MRLAIYQPSLKQQQPPASSAARPAAPWQFYLERIIGCSLHCHPAARRMRRQPALHISRFLAAARRSAGATRCSVGAVTATAIGEGGSCSFVRQVGVWVKLPGVANAAAVAGEPVEQALLPLDGVVWVVESASNHCRITVELDQVGCYAGFFGTGRKLGSPFIGLVAPSPALAFLRGRGQHLQAGVLNVTRLQEAMAWDGACCGEGLCIEGHTISKETRQDGRYSTVLCNKGYISGIHLLHFSIDAINGPGLICVGVCRGCMPLRQDPELVDDRTFYMSTGALRVAGQRLLKNGEQMGTGVVVTIMLDMDVGDITFSLNDIEQGRSSGLSGRLYPFVSLDSFGDKVTLLGSYTLPLNRSPRTPAVMEWDMLGCGAGIELSANCLTASKPSSTAVSSCGARSSTTAAACTNSMSSWTCWGQVASGLGWRTQT